MPALTCEPDHLLDALKLAAITAYSGKDDPTMSSLVCYTADRDRSGYPGGSLVLASSDGASAGICEIPVTGSLPRPIVIPPYDISWLSTMLKTAKSRAEEGTEIEIELEVSPETQTMTARALCDVPSPADRRGVVALGDFGAYPWEAVSTILATPAADGQTDLPEFRRAVLAPSYAGVLAAVAKSTKHPVSVSPSGDPQQPSSAVVSGSAEAIPVFKIVLPSTAGYEPAEVPDIALAPVA